MPLKHVHFNPVVQAAYPISIPFFHSLPHEKRTNQRRRKCCQTKHVIPEKAYKNEIFSTSQSFEAES